MSSPETSSPCPVCGAARPPGAPCPVCAHAAPTPPPPIAPPDFHPSMMVLHYGVSLPQDSPRVMVQPLYGGSALRGSPRRRTLPILLVAFGIAVIAATAFLLLR